MTGEVSWIKSTGEDSRGDYYPIHAAIAKALRVPLRPFDVYIGPYVATKKGWLFLDDNEGQVVLWPGGVAPAYCEPKVADYFPGDVLSAVAAARSLVRRK